ncbi:hypothetical protein I352_05335 [Cryptococcus deuterogattii MMRL2647]|nr:hypothetical protein I352_05335 [Cryptococcus deuterogattii MMRL2647]
MSKSDQENKVEDMLNDSALEVDIRSVHEKPVGGDALHEEVFQDVEGRISYRTVGWIRAASIFLKLILSTGILSIPSAMYELGAVGGAICILCFQAMNTYCGILYGRFRMNHPGVHGITDVAYIVGGRWFSEFIAVLYTFAMVFTASSGIVGGSVGLNSLSNHATCTVVFQVALTVVIAITASLPKLHQLGWVTWGGFASIFTAVFIVTIGVAVRDVPYAAPKGDYDFGYYAVPPSPPTFINGMTAALIIFCSGAGTSAFVPVMSEMRKPQDYNKAVYSCMSWVTVCYLTFGLVIYRYCGQWVASPALGSAGPVLEKVCYGIGMFGFIAAGCIFVHISAKYVFVRLLRGTRHLQEKTVVHWVVWLSCVWSLSFIAFVLGNVVPFYNYIFSLLGSFCWGIMALGLPALSFFYDNPKAYKASLKLKLEAGLNAFILILGTFIWIGGTYASIKVILQAYDEGRVSGIFACDDNAV